MISKSCEFCTNSFSCREQRQRFCSSKCSNRATASLRGKKCLDSSITKRGYVTVYIGPKQKRKHEHTVVAEKALGRKLKDNELVHHINGDKTDNRNCNLLICTRSYHRWLHEHMSLLYQRKMFPAKTIDPLPPTSLNPPTSH